MIAKDEERSIQRALLSASAVVDEMVVLDTGSTDDTRALAEEAGARVVSMTWPRDFSAARNAALEMTQCEFRLCLDADEYVTGGRDELREWCHLASGRAGTVAITSSFTSQGVTQFALDHIARVLPRGIRYVGRVHEQPTGGRPYTATGLQVNHDGYEPAQRERKSGRNEELLREELKGGRNPFLVFQLGKDLEVTGRYHEAAEVYEEALKISPEDARWQHDLVTRSIYTISQAGRRQDAVALFQRESTRWPNSPDIFFAGGNAILDLAVASPARAHDLIPLARVCWERCLQIGERPDLEGAVQGRGSFLARRNLDVISRVWRGEEEPHVET